ncbi:hypothetical protein AB0O47_39720 [Streptomyces noursei]|uniref:hypothetical protein n=1 Tax=Streptomyces noursei TaxID=1971 RepID=UPI00344CBAFA
MTTDAPVRWWIVYPPHSDVATPAPLTEASTRMPAITDRQMEEFSRSCPVCADPGPPRSIREDHCCEQNILQVLGFPCGHELAARMARRVTNRG